MSRRIAVVGLAALCAMAFAAFSASGAAAAGATAFTCVEASQTSEAQFKTSNCSVAGMNPEPGPYYKHQAIAAGTKTNLSLTATSKQVFSFELASAVVEMTSTEIECLGCTAENKEVGGVMEVTGTGGKILYKSVTTDIPHCVPQATGKALGTVETNALKFTTTVNTGARLEPETGTVLMVLHLVSSGGTCTLAGSYPVEGTVLASASADLLSVNTGPEETLTLAEEPASLTGTATITAGSGAERHPVVLT